MMSPKGMVSGLMVAILMATACPAFAEGSAVAGSVPQAAPVGPAASFVPADFSAPTLVETPRFKLVPLGPDLVKKDFDAYMSSIEHLQTTFSRSTHWPRADISASDAMKDMENEQARFRSRKSFDYSVLTPDGSREIGSVYVSPSPLKDYDAVVRLWVTKADYEAGFDAELYQWVVQWMRKDWPFVKVAYPGRSVEWGSWDAMVAASKAAKAGVQH